MNFDQMFIDVFECLDGDVSAVLSHQNLELPLRNTENVLKLSRD